MNDYIDLSIIERNLKEGFYHSTFTFINDVRRIFSKALKYMSDDHDVVRRADELSKLFEIFVKEIENLPLKE